MKKKDRWPWPDVMFYAVFGEPGPESTMKVPKDFDLCLEFIMRNMLAEEDAMFLRERYEQGMSERAIAQRHGLTHGHARGKIYTAIKKLRHPSRSRYLYRGMLDAVKSEIEYARKAAYNDGYQDGYGDCKEEFLSMDQAHKELVERIRKELPEYISDLGLSNHASWTLKRAGITKVETLLMLTKPQILAIEGIGTKTGAEIFARTEKLGFPLSDGKPDIYERK